MKKVTPLLFFIAFLSSGMAQNEGGYNLSFEQLAQMTYSNSSTMTPTEFRLQPAAITHLSREDLVRSGGRSINEILEMTIPNLQLERSLFNDHNTGLRGIMNLRDETFLYLVNGHAQQFDFLEGARFERALYLTGDIHSIDVIRGPSSVLYGPGALWGVINVQTFNGLNFEGADFKIQQVFIDESTAAEFRLGHKIDDESGIFFYYGIQDHMGADNDAAPVFYGNTFTATNGQTVEAGHRSPFHEPKDHHYSKAQHKAFFDFTKGNFNFWARYSREGEQTSGRWPFLTTETPGTANPTTSVDHILHYRVNDYESYMAQMNYKQSLSDAVNINYRLGFDYLTRSIKLARVNNTFSTFSNEEYKPTAQVILNWQVNKDHALAFGIEGKYAMFEDSLERNWDAYSYAALAEHQYTISDEWHSFMGVRIDKHRYTDEVYSPRWGLVYEPTNKDVLKMMFSRSVRRSADPFLRRDDQNGNDFEAETLDAIEFRYERQETKELSFALSSGFQVYDAVDNIAVIGAPGGLDNVGRYKIFFLELEALYKNDDWSVRASHSYTKLLESDEVDGIDPSSISVEAKGNGKDLAHWSNHITKLTVNREVSEKFSWSSSLVVYWGFPGSKDRAQYNSFERTPGPATRAYIDDYDYDQAFKANIYLNAGFQYQFNKQTKGRLDFYNILGWYDIDLNKRNYRDLSASYRSEAPAIALSFEYDF